MNSSDPKLGEIQYDQYDVVVVGGGISGLGSALEAVRRGYKVLLLERSASLGRGTSANSLRIIHGGFRYLQNGGFARVANSIAAQSQLVRKYPDLFAPLPCLMPLRRWGIRSKYPVVGAAAVFRVMAKGLGWPPKDKLPSVIDEAPESIFHQDVFPQDKTTPLLKWWDWQLVSHERLVETLVGEFADANGEFRLNALVVELQSATKFAGVILENGERILAKTVIDCRGSGVPSSKVKSWTTAFNLLLENPIDPVYGVALSANKRLLFAVPRQESSGALGAIGTWYIPGAEPFSAEKPSVGEDLILNAIADINAALPKIGLKRAHVVGFEAGVLPCTSLPTVEPVRLLGRERIETYGRIVKVISTKYTTFETQARWAINTAAEIISADRPKPPTQ